MDVPNGDGCVAVRESSALHTSRDNAVVDHFIGVGCGNLEDQRDSSARRSVEVWDEVRVEAFPGVVELVFHFREGSVYLLEQHMGSVVEALKEKAIFFVAGWLVSVKESSGVPSRNGEVDITGWCQGVTSGVKSTT